MTCHGAGEVSRGHGPERCPDCGGLGTIARGPTLTERRLRDLEQRYPSREREADVDINWLIFELRRCHHGLYQILAATQELEEHSPIGKKLRFFANEALALYPVEHPGKPDPDASPD